MPDVVSLFARGLDEFDRRVSAVDDEQWHAATPCAEWDVRALVNHVTGEQLWAPSLLAGRTMAEVGDRFDGDVLGDEPLDAWQRAAAGSRAAAEEPGVLSRTVHVSYGDVTAEHYLTEMTLDLAVHGWDLARGIDADDRIDPDLVSLGLAYAESHRDLLTTSGLFRPPRPVPPGSDPQTRLVALLGRNP